MQSVPLSLQIDLVSKITANVERERVVPVEFGSTAPGLVAWGGTAWGGTEWGGTEWGGTACGGTECGGTPSNEEQVWGQEVSLVYPERKIM